MVGSGETGHEARLADGCRAGIRKTVLPAGPGRSRRLPARRNLSRPPNGHARPLRQALRSAVKRRPFGRKIFFPERAVVHEVRRERDDAGMSAVSGASPDAAPSGAVRAVELSIRGDRTSCAATVEKKLIKLAEGLLAAAVLARCGTPQAPVTPGVVKVVAGENFWGNIAAQVGGRHARRGEGRRDQRRAGAPADLEDRRQAGAGRRGAGSSCCPASSRCWAPGRGCRR